MLIFFSTIILMSSGINEIQPVKTERAGTSMEALTWLKSTHEDFRNVEFRLETTKQSLLGTHYYFQQTHLGIPMNGAEAVVSVGQDSKILKAFTTAQSKLPNQKIPFNVLEKEDAYELAWQHLQVYDYLRGAPQCEMRWKKFKANEWELIYQVTLPVWGPMGTWKVDLDASTGNILAVEDTLKDHLPIQQKTSHPQINRKDAFQIWSDFAVRDAVMKNAQQVDGQGLVFDPDPVTTLGMHLEDHFDPSIFDPAYKTVTLRDITQDGGTFTLSGPYCSIEDGPSSIYRSPNTPPSTTTDGNWTFKRGNNGFNDAMTYYLIDKNQRYIQSLGYTDQKSIQNGPIKTDTDAVNGQDQSLFDGSNNSLYFGHGCVDDSEDADVILHEYGHAMQDHMTTFWFGGDTPAMGEGFGDYWAGSYSYSTPEGPFYHPEWMFTWDGHNQCWGGRVMDALELQYDPNRTYGDHDPLPGGHQTDELWSTPLFQAMLELHRQGFPIRHSDTIVLESHFGLTSGPRMPDLADLTVQAAASLYPNGPHADVFQASFARHNILNGKSNFQTLATHIPPSGNESGDWSARILLTNPNSSSMVVQYNIYSADAEQSQNFSLLESNNITLAPYQTQVVEPGGEHQRWASFESPMPLTGQVEFYRSPTEESGEEKSSLPLTPSLMRGSKIIFPHIPSDRQRFWSGGVILNPLGQSQNLSITLIGEQGSDLSHLLSVQNPLSFNAFEKMVTLFAGTLFDDSASGEKVAYIEISGMELAGFQLFGFQDSSGDVATSGILATPDIPFETYHARMNLGPNVWTGHAILNPGPITAQLKVTALDASGTVLGFSSFDLNPKTKVLGLNLAAGYSFPYNSGQSVLNIPGDKVATVIIESAEPLRVFELMGDENSTTIDGGSAFGGTNHLAVGEPNGVLEIKNGPHAQNVVINLFQDNQERSDMFPVGGIAMQAYERRTFDLSGQAFNTLQVLGTRVTAHVLVDDTENKSLMVKMPVQIDGLMPQN